MQRKITFLNKIITQSWAALLARVLAVYCTKLYQMRTKDWGIWRDNPNKRVFDQTKKDYLWSKNSFNIWNNSPDEVRLADSLV